MGLAENLFRKTERVLFSDFKILTQLVIADVLKVTPQAKIYVFGSVARNTATNNSDLDILVVLPRIADNDLYAAEFLLNAEKVRPELIIFQAQQTVENSIKAVLVFDEQPVPLTHDIDILISHLKQDDQDGLPEGASELTRFATVKRYTEGDEDFEKKRHFGCSRGCKNLSDLGPKKTA